MRRSTSLASVLLVSTALVGPAGAAPTKRCSYPDVRGPSDYAEEHRTAAIKAPAVEVSDRHDEAHPLEITYRHSAGATVFHQADVNMELIFHTLRINSRSARPNLWLRAEFSDTATDVDLYVYGRNGEQVGYSESANNGVVDAVGSVVFYPVETGGPGFENINGMPARRCGAYTVETQNSFVVAETPVRLLVWLGPPGKGGH
ncbi:MAG TPA: hypothetical protein VNA12_00030 [Mycobacteriales bacterium]|nr:hypothetical protein [Mycobacteriales bacterium]